MLSGLRQMTGLRIMQIALRGLVQAAGFGAMTTDYMRRQMLASTSL
jgi:hypothetical protein